MTSERTCYVYIMLPGQTEFVTAGRFTLTPTDDGLAVGHFIYGKKFLARNDRVEIDPVELKLSNRPFETATLGGFFGAIRDSMPDSWGRRIIEKRSGHPQLDEFDYLMESADDRAGALGFGLNVEPPAPRREFNKTLQLEQLQIAADLITNEDKEPKGELAKQVIKQAEDLLYRGSAMGGARPKAVIEDDNAMWIAKFSHPDDRWNHPKVEHGILQLATTCGLDVADSRIVEIAGRDVLLVRRFDRDHTEEGFRRHRMVSALTLLRADDRVTERTNWSYLLLADEIRRTSANPSTDLNELYKRICFNAAISNLDDHPRNHAMIAKDTGWRLSPAYDLTPAPVSAISRRDLAMECGDQGRYANRANIISDHGRFYLEADNAEQIFDGIVETIRGEWLAHMRRIGVTDADCERISKAFLYEGLFYG